jgi:hypothetical protein
MMTSLLKHAALGGFFALALAVTWGVIGQIAYTMSTLL